MTQETYIEVDETHRIEVMPSGNHYPMIKHDGEWCYFRKSRNVHQSFRTERGARKFLAEYIQRVG